MLRCLVSRNGLLADSQQQEPIYYANAAALELAASVALIAFAAMTLFDPQQPCGVRSWFAALARLRFS